MKLEGYKKIYNLYYGYCYILKEKENCYLVYVEKNQQHYIVCTYIDTNNALMGQKFFDNLEDAENCFEEK